MQWLVTAPFKDIADFYVNIRDSKNKLFVERHLSYEERLVQIPGSEISDDYNGQLELCVLGKKSDGTIGSWFDSQCIYLPENFENIKRTYNANKNQPYIIHSIRKKVKAATAGSAGSNATQNGHSVKSSGDRTNVMNHFTLIATIFAYFSLRSSLF